MFFTDRELSAIMNVAGAIAMADGEMAREEKIVISKEFMRFGCNAEKVSRILNESEQMEPQEACQIISKMSAEEKRYVASFLMIIMCADNKIMRDEVQLISLISIICGLPNITLQEALKTMENL